MEKMIPVEKFVYQNSIERVETSLQIFSSYHAKKLPSFLIDSKVESAQIMLDILQVKGRDVFLPVVVRSTAWLRFINEVEGNKLKICLNNERWPFQQRFGLAGGFTGVLYPENALGGCLDNSLDSFNFSGKISKASVSERVANLATSKEFKALIKKVQVIELSEEYKNEEVNVF